MDKVADLLADGVLHEQRVGGDAEHDVTRARVRVEEPHVLPQHGVQVRLPERDHLPLPGVHPARDLWGTKECSFFRQYARNKNVLSAQDCSLSVEVCKASVYRCSGHAAGMDADELACRIRRHENETNVVNFSPFGVMVTGLVRVSGVVFEMPHPAMTGSYFANTRSLCSITTRLVQGMDTEGSVARRSLGEDGQ